MPRSYAGAQPASRAACQGRAVTHVRLGHLGVGSVEQGCRLDHGGRHQLPALLLHDPKGGGTGSAERGPVWQERCSGPRWSSRNRRSDASTRAQSLRRDGGGAAERFKPKRYVRAPDAARPHPEADGVRHECPEFAAPPRMTGLSAPRLGEARALLGTARPRRCLTAAAVRGWAGTLRCRGTPATAGAAGGAGRTRSHDPARPWVRQCARRLLQWGQSLTVRPARGARRAPRPRPARLGRRRPRRTPRGRTTRRRAAPTRPAGPATDPGRPAGRSPSSAGHPRPARDRPRTTPTARPASGRPASTSSRRPPLQHASYRTPVRTKTDPTAMRTRSDELRLWVEDPYRTVCGRRHSPPVSRLGPGEWHRQLTLDRVEGPTGARATPVVAAGAVGQFWLQAVTTSACR